MKTSLRILLFGGVALIVLELAMAAGSMSRAQDEQFTVQNSAGSIQSELQLTSVDIEPFSQIKISGAFNVHIFAFSQCTVLTHIDTSGPGMHIDQTDNLLTIQTETSETENMPVALHKIAIGMPRLGSLYLKGLTDVVLDSLVTEHLVITTEGITTLKARNCQIDSLDIVAQGVQNQNWRNSSINRASVQAEGLGTVAFHLDGGLIHANVEGLLDVTVTGSPAVAKVVKNGNLVQ